MGENLGLLRDFAIVMVAAGVVTLLFRKLRQPPVVGYLLAGFLLGPHLPLGLELTDLDTISMLADIGLVLLLFGVGLEFSWTKIRQIGLAVIVVGGIEILTMISVGYGVGRLLGWSRLDSLYLGAALHISSSAIIVKVLRDTGKLGLVSSRVIVGILVVEDLAAVIIIATLSAISTTGTANIVDIGSLLLRLAVFLVASLLFGGILVPRILSLASRFRSGEVYLITGLALCFSMALLSRYLGLSVAVGAFLMGALIGDTGQSKQVTSVMSPVRDMFGAIFFVTIGVLTEVGQFALFIVPAVIVCLVFILGKIISNTVAAFMSGYDGRTSLQVGMGMPQMGEFSLALAKVGVDSSAVVAPLYPVVAATTTVTSIALPYLSRSADSVAGFLSSRSPRYLRDYLMTMAQWLATLRSTLSRESEASGAMRRSARTIFLNLLVVLVVFGVGSFALQFAGSAGDLLRIRSDIIALAAGFVVVLLTLPSAIVIWRNLRVLVHEASRRMLAGRGAGVRRTEILAAVLRSTIVAVLSVLLALWLIPFVSQLFFVGSIALALPAVLLALVAYLVFSSVRRIHTGLQQSVNKVILGEVDPENPAIPAAGLPPEGKMPESPEDEDRK